MNKNNLRILVFGLLLFSACHVYAEEVATANEKVNPAGNFSYTKGIVERSADEKSWVSVKEGDFFYPMDIIRTSDDGKAELLFKNGSIVWMSSLSKMVISEEKSDRKSNVFKTKLKLLFGKTTSSVEKLFNEDSRFEVETNVAVAAVKGTKYYVAHNEAIDDSEIGVFDGSVEVENKQGIKQVLEKDTYLNVNTTGKISEPKKIEEDKKQEQNQLEESANIRMNLFFKKAADSILDQMKNPTLLASWKTQETFNQWKVKTIDALSQIYIIISSKLTSENKDLYLNVMQTYQSLEKEMQKKFEELLHKVPLKTPEGLEVFLTDDGAVALTWASSTEKELVGYLIYRNDQKYADVKSTEYQDLSIEFGKTYSYSICAYDKDKNLSLKTKPISIIISNKKAFLVPPTQVIANLDLLKAAVKISWQPSLSVDTIGYSVYRNKRLVGLTKDSQFYDFLLKDIKLGDTLVYTIKSRDILQKEGDSSESTEVEILNELPEIQTLYFNDVNIDSIDDTIQFLQDDLVGGKIQIKGTVLRLGFAIKSVYISLDQGTTWYLAQGTEIWQYSFVPQTTGVISIQVKAEDILGNMVVLKPNQKISFLASNREELAKKFISDWQNLYNIKDVKNMMKMVSTDYSPDSLRLKDEIDSTWTTYDSVALEKLQPTAFRRNGNMIEIDFKWTRKFSFSGYTNGLYSNSATYCLIWEDNQWKLLKLSGTSPFYINDLAPGTFSITNPTQARTYSFDSSAITLEWSAAADTGLGIKSYDVYVDNFVYKTVSYNIRSVTLSDLAEGDHSVWIIAKDFKDKTRQSNTVTIIIDQKPPSPPTL